MIRYIFFLLFPFAHRWDYKWVGGGGGGSYTRQFTLVIACTENIAISATIWEHQIYLFHTKITNLFYN